MSGADPALSRVRDVSVFADPGLRGRMEDRHAVMRYPEIGLFAGIFDGHGGVGAAEVLAGGLPDRFLHRLGETGDPAQAFYASYRDLEERLQGEDSGSVAATVFLTGETLIVAHVGDTRVVGATDGGGRALTEDHRVTNPAERARIQAAGGHVEGLYIIRGLRGLMPTRSFGDAWFRAVGVHAIPEVSHHRVSHGIRAVVLACDGVWDVVAPGEIGQILDHAPPDTPEAEAIGGTALARGTTDNVTVVVATLWRDGADEGSAVT